MLNIVLNHAGPDDLRRKVLQSGAILMYSASGKSRALAELAKNMARQAFDGMDPEHAQESLPVEKFVAIVSALKTQFTNGAQTKERLLAYLIEMGVDPELTYFDLPRLRVVPHSNYLSSGVSYAYKAHRDIWYASPTAQINWWLPVWDVVPDRSMAFFPGYWDRPMPNSSEQFDYGEWVRVGRAAAVSQVGVDTRKHPLPLQELTPGDEFRFGAATGDAVLFSASHLHATVPNTTASTRFSIDFRTVNVMDLRNHRGGPNIDSRAQGSTLGDFLSVKDLRPLELTADLQAV